MLFRLAVFANAAIFISVWIQIWYVNFLWKVNPESEKKSSPTKDTHTKKQQQRNLQILFVFYFCSQIQNKTEQ